MEVWRGGGVEGWIGGRGYRGVHKEEESSIMHKQRLGFGHMHTHAHNTQYIPLYCYSYSLSYNCPNKEVILYLECY